MKETKLKFLIVFLCCSYFANAQMSNSNENYPLNIIKTNPFADASGNLNLSYERVVSDYNSANFRIRTTVFNPFINSFKGQTITGANNSFLFNTKPSISTISMDLEYRFYSKVKTGPKGFYAAPYLRYNHIACDFNADYSGIIYGPYKTISADLNIKPNILGAGVQLGAQWLINNRITIDWSFFGMGLDLWLLKLNVNSTNLKYDYGNIKADIDEFSASSPLKAKVEIDDNEMTIRSRFFIPGFKSGLTIGYAF